MIVAGEASGDLYGARLVEEAKAMRSDIRFFGMAGERMRAAGAETLVDANDMAVVGLVEVVAHLPTIVRAFRKLTRAIETERPDLVILIDYQDFNQRLAAEAKKRGAKVLFYISPQVWAWRAGRVKKMSKIIDHMAVLFDFEIPYYERERVPVSFVGHPLLDLAHPSLSRDEAFVKFGLDPSRPVAGIFPGSRRSEIRNLFTSLLGAAQLLRARYPELQFVLPLASSLTRDDIDPQIRESGLDITIVEKSGSCDVAQVCDAVMSVSGTVTMEIALMEVPMVIVYKVSPLTYAVGKRLIKVDHIGICNIVAGERVVQELLQEDAEPRTIATEMERLLFDRPYADAIRAKLKTIRGRLGSGGCSRRVAETALRLAEGN